MQGFPCWSVVCLVWVPGHMDQRLARRKSEEVQLGRRAAICARVSAANQSCEHQISEWTSLSPSFPDGGDAGSARHAAPTGAVKGLCRRDERNHLRTRHATCPDDGHNSGGDRSIRARPDQRAREIGVGRGEGARDEVPAGSPVNATRGKDRMDRVSFRPESTPRSSILQAITCAGSTTKFRVL